MKKIQLLLTIAIAALFGACSGGFDVDKVLTRSEELARLSRQGAMTERDYNEALDLLRQTTDAYRSLGDEAVDFVRSNRDVVKTAMHDRGESVPSSVRYEMERIQRDAGRLEDIYESLGEVLRGCPDRQIKLRANDIRDEFKDLRSMIKMRIRDAVR